MVTEGQLFNICVAITSPPPQLFLWPLNSSFLIQLTIVPLTAGVRDIGKDNASLAIVGPFNDARRFYCLQLTAVADRVLQGTRSLNLTASLYGVAQPLLTISPNTTTVTIIDSTQIVIGFTQTQYTVTRKDSYVTFNVSILGGATIQGASVGVMFSTGDGTALAGADYDARTQLLVFNNTVTQLPIVVTIKDDGSVQTNVTIKDDHVLVIGFDPVVYSANVNGDSVAITVKVLQGSLAVPVSIRVFTENGTATSGSDYVATSQSVVFDSSSTNHTVTIQLINKLVSDASKVFSVGLSVETPEAKGRVTLSPSVANVTIVNTNVAVIGFVAGVYSVRKSEGSVCMMVGLLQGQLGAPVTVTFSTYLRDSHSWSGFHTNHSSTGLQNTVTQLPIIVTIKDDGVFKYTDVYFGASLTLQSARGFEHLITLNPHQTNVTIKDDHVLAIGFDPVVYRANVNGDSVAITVKVLQGSLAVPVSIRVFTEDGTATSGSDYVATSQSVVFDSSSTNHTVTIQLINKLVSDASKVFSVGLSVETPEAKGRVTLSPSVANVTIVNTNVAVIGFVAGVYSVRKSEGSVSMMVGLLQGQLGAPVTVTFSTYSGTATAGLDFTQTTLPLVFNNTVTQLPISVTIKDDGVFKYTDVYFGASLTLQSARGFEHLITLNPHQTNVTIKDDHVLVIGFDPVVYRANVNGDSVAITVKVLQGSLAVPVSIRVFTEDGTATSGSDYVATSQSVVFDSSSTNHTVTIQLINKLVSDASKMFSVGLSVETPEAKGRVTLSPSVANVTIVNTNVAVIGFVAGVYSVRKSEGSVSMMVGLLQGQLGAPVTVTFSTYSGTATAGQDFTQTTLPLVFNNTVTQLPIIVTIKDDGVFKYTDVYFGASLTLQSARGFEHLITLNPHQTNVTIKDDHVLVIGFDPVVYSANVNGDSVAITVKVLQGSLALPVSIRVFTENGTATSGSDYVATSQSVVFDSSSTNHTVTIQLINKLVSDASKMFSVGLSVETPEAKGRVTLSPSVANVTVQGVLQNIEVNDSMIADPLFTVPLNVHSELFPALSLCYEIHGQPRQYYNLVSDTCTSVNARYNASLNGVGVNIIDDITVRAVDRAGQCVDIEVDVDCGVSVGGSRVQIYSLNEVYVRTYGNSSVRISVPNCNHQQLVMWILCQVRPIEDPITGKKFSAKMQKFVVTRGLSLGENSHGIIAQFWGVQASVTKYNGSYSVAPYPGSAYYILTMQSGGKSRSVLSSVYKFTWERLGGPCLYAGDGEAGWMVGGNLSNDLIDGQPDDYIVSSAFETNFKYSRFTQSCPDRLH
eukprot:Em0010g133a